MEKFITTITSHREALEKRWQHVPARQRKRILLYAFGCYVVLTLAVIIQVVSQIGHSGKDILQVKHITNPVVTPVKNIESGNNTKTIQQDGK